MYDKLLAIETLKNIENSLREKVDILPLFEVILQMTDDLKTDILSTSVV